MKSRGVSGCRRRAGLALTLTFTMFTIKKVSILSSLLLLFFVNEVFAYPGVSLKGNGLSFGNIREEGELSMVLALLLVVLNPNGLMK